MPQLGLTGGFYQARSLLANAQRCLNLYPEKNPEDSPSPYTMYLTPGLRTLRAANSVDGPSAGVARGGYVASTGAGFVVVGQVLYYVDADWKFIRLGDLLDALTTPVSMYDNGFYLILVDGSASGYTVDLNTFTFAIISDPNFFGSDRVDYIDTFLTFSIRGTRQWYSSDSNSISFDPLAIASKTGLPDPIQTHICMHREVWLLGTNRSTEVWYNAGTSPFPFQISPGVFIEQGCVAKYSLCKNDLMLFWLGRDKDGLATVFLGQPGGRITRISTPALASVLGTYAVVTDAIGMTYKQQDHVFYVLTFPSANATWVYDVSEGLWHERCWLNGEGGEERIRANWATLMYSTIVCGDRETGTLYALDLATYDDVGSPIVRRRGFQHLVEDGNQVSYPVFRAHMQAGEAPQDVTDVAVFLRWSDDGGRTWGTPIQQSLGLVGEYFAQPQFRQLGMARDRVFELFWSAPVNTALLGGWIAKPQSAST